MRPEWLNEIEAVAPDRTVVGVGILVTDRVAPELLHVGIVFKVRDMPAQFLHLAFHALVKCEPLLEDLHYWAPLAIDADVAESLAGYCRRMPKRSAIPYGVVYDNERVAQSGLAELDGKAIGLTCATYVLATLRGANVGTLIDIETWLSRDEDKPWHCKIVHLLVGWRRARRVKLTPEHICAVMQEQGCARIRAEEVAAACHRTAWPVPFAQAEPDGAEARRFLLASPESLALETRM